jgi:phage N-6-adenine-methyltransferase
MSVNIHFSSKTDLWATPQKFFDDLNREFGFTLDVCALPENAKCENYFTPEIDGLKQKWGGSCYMNPPYGRTIKEWMAKAYAEAQTNADVVVCLVPARTDTVWWHEYAMLGEIRFLKGRLKFGDQKNSAPFPSAVVIFRKGAA